MKERVDGEAARHLDWVTSVSSSAAGSGPKGGGGGASASDDVSDLKLVSGGKDGRVIVWKWTGDAWRAAQVLEVKDFRQATGEKAPEGVNHAVSKVSFAHVGTMILVSYSALDGAPAATPADDAGGSAPQPTKRSQSVLLKEGTGGKFEQVLEVDAAGFGSG